MRTGHRILAIGAASVLILGAAAVGGPSTSGDGPLRRGQRWQGGGGRHQRPGMSVWLTRRLDLTEEQTEKIRSISQESRAQAREANKAVVEARELDLVRRQAMAYADSLDPKLREQHLRALELLEQGVWSNAHDSPPAF